MNKMMHIRSAAPVEGVFHAKPWLELRVNGSSNDRTRALGST